MSTAFFIIPHTQSLVMFNFLIIIASSNNFSTIFVRLLPNQMMEHQNNINYILTKLSIVIKTWLYETQQAPIAKIFINYIIKIILRSFQIGFFNAYLLIMRPNILKNLTNDDVTTYFKWRPVDLPPVGSIINYKSKFETWKNKFKPRSDGVNIKANLPLPYIFLITYI